MVRIELKFINCSIICNKKTSLKEMIKVMDKEGGDDVDPSMYQCTECKQRWSSKDIIENDIRNISCSNCYSNKINLIQVRLIFTTYK